MNYLEFLENDFKESAGTSGCENHWEYLSAYVFGFNTYDDEMDKLFASRAIEVCRAIQKSTTFEYIADSDNYQWFLIMCNMPFFRNRLEWGTSIRGAWWDGEGGLCIGGTDFIFTRETWIHFIGDLLAFSDSHTD